jgi:hypothetical protein
MAQNDITGDELKSKTSTDAYRAGWDRIFGKKEPPKVITPPEPEHDPVRTAQTQRWWDFVEKNQRNLNWVPQFREFTDWAELEDGSTPPFLKS